MITIESTKGTKSFATVELAAAWLAEYQPSHAAIGGEAIEWQLSDDDAAMVAAVQRAIDASSESSTFVPTHEIKLTDRDGTVTTTLVQLVDGVAYTQTEWESDTSADWAHDPAAGWTFQGRPTPHAWQTIDVRPIASAH